ncbi:hypothetical protein J3A83DRAFT_4247174 [Scleroderma citrinum]
MGPVPAREALEAMKRVDIQKLCKDYGVKANLKTEALIDLLLDASRPLPPRSNATQQSERSTPRIPSRSGSRRGSVIIHGTCTDSLERDTSLRPPNEDQPTPLPSFLPPQPTRTRKAKESQYRLGVGRPVAAGGSGARAITKSISTSRRPKRGKSSTVMEPSEATITEEPEPEEYNNDPLVKENPSDTNRSSLHLDESRSAPLIPPELVQSAVAEALAPVQQELDSQKSQLAELRDKVSCMITSFEARIRVLTLEVEHLRAKAKGATAVDGSASDPEGPPARIPQPPSTPKRVWSPHRSYLPFSEKDVPSELSSDSMESGALGIPEAESSNNPQPTHAGILLPGFAHTILGKRGRDSASWEDEEPRKKDGPNETELEAKMGHSASKRTKLRAEDEEDDHLTHKKQSELSFGRAEESEGVDEPGPVVERLPEFYSGPSSPPLISAPTSTVNNIESINPFNFSFLPSASTPAQAAYPLSMGSFPFPEPPTSPSPANASEKPHSDALGPFGLQRPGMRSSSGQGASGAAQSHGETSGSAGLQRKPSSNDVASQLGLTAIRTSAAEPGTPVPPAKRTMYGTEVEGETRFGDFGVEGVASGFWTRGRF